jgi:serine/threonine protein kinase
MAADAESCSVYSRKANSALGLEARGKSNCLIHFITTYTNSLTVCFSSSIQNFLFVKGALKLIDFGIAKAIESQDTTNIYRDNLTGTISYMSPEALDIITNANGRETKCGRVSLYVSFAVYMIHRSF